MKNKKSGNQELRKSEAANHGYNVMKRHAVRLEHVVEAQEELIILLNQVVEKSLWLMRFKVGGK
jgi:hypothetical protein